MKCRKKSESTSGRMEFAFIKRCYPVSEVDQSPNTKHKNS